jgi:glyoxylase-like metal-dependent hydrolase (beta-lactamase superfamily II)
VPIDRPNDVFAVRVGRRQTDTRSGKFYRYGIYGLPDDRLVMDFYFWVIVRGSSVVLFDTGYSQHALTHRGEAPFLVEPMAALGHLGIGPEDVTDVIVSHFHWDHTGNIAQFPNARLSFQQAELDFWTGPIAAKPTFVDTIESHEVDYLAKAHADGRVNVLTGDAELFPGITALHVGGHTPGQQMLRIERPGRRPVILTSDAAHFYEEVDDDRAFLIFADLPGLYSTYARLRDLQADGAAVVAGHDPLVMERFAPVPGSEEFAVLIE